MHIRVIRGQNFRFHKYVVNILIRYCEILRQLIFRSNKIAKREFVYWQKDENFYIIIKMNEHSLIS